MDKFFVRCSFLFIFYGGSKEEIDLRLLQKYVIFGPVQKITLVFVAIMQLKLLFCLIN
jgi:hypothetical protein